MMEEIVLALPPLPTIPGTVEWLRHTLETSKLDYEKPEHPWEHPGPNVWIIQEGIKQALIRDGNTVEWDNLFGVRLTPHAGILMGGIVRNIIQSINDEIRRRDEENTFSWTISFVAETPPKEPDSFNGRPTSRDAVQEWYSGVDSDHYDTVDETLSAMQAITPKGYEVWWFFPDSVPERWTCFLIIKKPIANRSDPHIRVALCVAPVVP